MSEFGKFTYHKSTRKNKKLMTTIDNKTIHFGDSSYHHYHDKTGIWDELDHMDTNQRRAYRKRHGKIKLKDGSLAKDNKMSPAYHSWRVLW